MKKYIFLFSVAVTVTCVANAQALSKAAIANDTIQIMKLLKEGGDPNELDENGTSPLMNASRWANVEMVRLLLNNGARADYPRSAKGRTPLIIACAYYSGLTICQLLVEHGADVNAVTVNGETALMLAASNAKVAVVDYLLKKGADPNLRDAAGKTALDKAKEATIDEYLEKSVKDTPIDKEKVIASLQAVTRP